MKLKSRGRLTVVALAAATLLGIGLLAYVYVARDVGSGVADGPLRIGLALRRDQAAVGAAIPLTVTLSNKGDAALTVARPRIVPNMVFLEVTRDGGEEVPFDGPYLELKPLRRDEFVELAPGGSVAHELDLAAFYQLEPGGYTVVAIYRSSQDGSHLGLNAVRVDEVRSAAVSLRVR